MLRRHLLTAAVVLVAIASALPAEAGECSVGPNKPGLVRRFLRNMGRDFKRNNCWPDPFIPGDRVHVYAPFGTMVSNGWRSFNTLGHHHFREDEARLTEAGELKIRSILTDAPADYRTIFVLNGDDQELNAGRVQAVQEFVASMAGEGEVPQVVATGISARGWPADYIDGHLRRFQATQPDPRIPARAGSSGSSGGSGQSGQ